jgi:hypothetical protein
VNQHVRVVSIVRIGADPDAGIDLQVFLVDQTASRQRAKNFSGDEHGVFGTPNLRKQYHEFISAVATDGVRPAHSGQNAVRYLLQQPVPNGVSERVVDAFEVIEIHKHHR